MFDSYTSDTMSNLEPCDSCGGIGFGGCTCDEQTMAAMEDYDSLEDYENDQTAARETILNGDY